ncbi:unnamed protein product, partial [Brachionus calyciflorus]
SIDEDLSHQVTSSNQKDQTDDLSDELNNKLSFDPPLYIQRYDYVLNYLNKFKCKTIMDIGCAECKFIHFLKQMNDDLNLIVGVDMDDEVLEKGKNKFTDNLVDIIHPRKNPLDVFIIKGDISQPDKYFLDKFSYENSGLEFVSLIEIIEHMYEETLDKCIDTVFSQLKPKYVLITTPNSEFNIVFEELDQNNNNKREHDERKINPKFRHWDHKFEWTRLEFETWCQNRILNQYKQYKLFNDTYDGLGVAPEGYENVGFCTQIALFVNEDYCQENTTNDFQVYLKEKKRIYLKNRNLMPDEKVKQDMYYQPNDTHSFENSKRFKVNTNEEYKVMHSFNYPFELYEFENESDRNEVLLDELYHAILFVTTPSKYSKYSYTQNSCDNNDILSGHLTEEEKEKLNNDIDLYDDTIRLAKVEILFDFNSIKKFNLTQKELIRIMKENKFQFTKNDKYVIHTIKYEESSSESSSSSSVVEYEDSYYSKKNLDNYFEINEKMSIEMNESYESSKTTSNSEFFDDENWDIYFNEQEPIHTNISKKPTLVDQFEDADGNDFTWSEEYIQKCLNFQPKSRRDRLRLSDFNSYNYNYENQIKITYNLRAARKKNRVCSLDTFDLNKEQFTLD